MRWNWECPSCEQDNDSAAPFGRDVTCEKCGKTFETDMEEDWDSIWFWITGPAQPGNERNQ